MFSSKRTSWLYISGERRLRESAGTSCGIEPGGLGGLGARSGVPPASGVCAARARPTASAPSGEAARLEELAAAEVGAE